jgi:hypothetical protein
MELLQTIVLLCQLNGAGADSSHLIEYAEKKQLQCQQYYIKCLNSDNLATYKDLSKCIKERKL